ncbi:unnamed protein product [Sphagnum troendelagicum]|uniref:Uncharacterized protein n=1 Tax=Sphagnum troendelagicum TaxID=128251 RepID=A0ABP0TVF2_9BRYO
MFVVEGGKDVFDTRVEGVAKSFWLCVWMPCLQQTVPCARPAALPRARCIESKAAPRVHGIGQKLIVEELWPEFFLAPLQWLGSQANAQYPDFKPKKTGKGLWLNNKLNLPWVEAKVAALPPGTV